MKPQRFALPRLETIDNGPDKIDTSAMMTNAKRIGKAVAGYRADAEMTLVQAGEQIGIDKTHLYKIEIGQVEASISTIARIARGYHVTLRAVLTRAGLI